jgi:hypothetical protein
MKNAFALFIASSLITGGVATAAQSGSYLVPVPSELASYAHFPVTHVELTQTGNHLSLRYDLPGELVGEKGITIEVEGDGEPGGFTRVSNDFGTVGYCRGSQDGKRACLLQYPGMHTDLAAADKFLTSHYKASELLQRRDVTRLFHDDPAGILIVRQAH